MDPPLFHETRCRPWRKRVQRMFEAVGQVRDRGRSIELPELALFDPIQCGAGALPGCNPTLEFRRYLIARHAETWSVCTAGFVRQFVSRITIPRSLRPSTYRSYGIPSSGVVTPKRITWRRAWIAPVSASEYPVVRIIAEMWCASS